MRGFGGKMKNLCLMTILSIFSIGVNTQAADTMKAYPPAKKGMVRYVLQPPKQENESDFKVEILVGKTVQIDKENRYFFGGRIEKETIEGWGFPHYVVNTLGPMGGTLMAVDPNAPKVDRFITIGGEPYLILYNSRLPIVVYVPDGVEVRYQIWSTDGEMVPMEKG
jgi:ecotin